LNRGGHRAYVFGVMINLCQGISAGTKGFIVFVSLMMMEKTLEKWKLRYKIRTWEQVPLVYL
jgi:hypothetical protein